MGLSAVGFGVGTWELLRGGCGAARGGGAVSAGCRRGTAWVPLGLRCTVGLEKAYGVIGAVRGWGGLRPWGQQPWVLSSP